MSHPHPAVRLRVALLWMGALLSAGCGQPPEERIVEAQAAAEMKDMERFAAQFTQRSSDLLRHLQEVSSRTRGELTYLEDIFTILPQGSVQGSEDDGQRAVVVVATETGSSEIVLLKEGGEWKIDAMSLPRMWLPAGGDG